MLWAVIIFNIYLFIGFIVALWERNDHHRAHMKYYLGQFIVYCLFWPIVLLLEIEL